MNDNKQEYKYLAFREIKGWNVTVRADDLIDLDYSADWIQKHFLMNNLGSEEPLQENMEEINEALEEASNDITCETCNAPATIQESTNKNGNPYKLLKCSKNYKHNKFLPV